MLLANVLFASALAFDAGADLRIRQEMMDNVPGLPGGGVLNPSERGKYKNHMRFRGRLWGELTGRDAAGADWRLYARMTDECRWYVAPSSPRPYAFPDELILDNLYLDVKGLLDGLMDFRIGRQDIYGLYGLDHVFVDGTPGDGSRTVYSDVMRVGFDFGEKRRLDFFALYDFDDSDVRWGTDDGKHRSLSGLGARGAEKDMDDWGFGAVWSAELSEGVPYNLFIMQKNTREYRVGGAKHPSTQRELLGFKVVPRLDEEWSLQFEAMGQVGQNGRDETLCGASTYAGVNWKSVREGWRPFGKFGYHFMSGDDDASMEDGGRSAWDPMWARGVNDSELFLYGTHYGAAWWSNMHYAKLTTGLDFGKYHKLTVSCGPLFSAAQDGLGGGNGHFKGVLSQVRYDFPLFTNEVRQMLSWGEQQRGSELFGHVLAEFFNPGDYYESDRPAWFIRWQVDLKF